MAALSQMHPNPIVKLDISTFNKVYSYVFNTLTDEYGHVELKKENATIEDAKTWLDNNVMRETFAKIFCSKEYKNLNNEDILMIYNTAL